MAYTLLKASEILTPAGDEAITAGVTKSKVTALQKDQMTEFIYQLNAEFVFAAHGKHHAKGWSHLRKPGNFVTHTHNSLAAAIAVGATSFSLNDSSAFSSSGKLAIETTRGGLDFVDFSDNTANLITVSSESGADTVTIAHSTNRVHELYAVPSDFGRVHEFWVNTREFRPEKFSGQFPCGGHYALYDDHFLMPRGMYAADVSLLYEKKPNDITQLTSETNIPREFQRWAIEMTLFHLHRVRRKRADQQTTLELAAIEMEKALNYDMTQHSSNQIRLA